VAAVHFSELYPDVLPACDVEQLDKLRFQTPRPLVARTDDLGGMFSLCLLAGQDTGAMAGDAVCFRGIWYVRNHLRLMQRIDCVSDRCEEYLIELLRVARFVLDGVPSLPGDASVE
jgi:hypothetical protein